MQVNGIFQAAVINGFSQHLSSVCRAIRIALLSTVLVTLVACGLDLRSAEEKLQEAIDVANLAFDEGRLEDAKVNYLIAIALDDQQLEVYRQLILIAEQEQDIQSAFNHLSHIASITPDDFDLVWQIGAIYFAAEELEQALEVAEKLRELRPQDKQAFLFITDLTQRLGYLEQTYEQSRRFLETQPNDPDALAFLAWEQVELGNEEEALRILDLGLQALPLDIQLNQAKAYILVGYGEYQQTEAMFIPLTDEYPLDVSVHQTLSQVYLYQNKLDEAARLMASLSRTDNAEVVQHMAEIDFLVDTNQFEYAIERLQTHISTAPNHLTYRLNLGSLYEAIGNSSEAIDAYQRLIDIPVETATDTDEASPAEVQEFFDIARSNLAKLLFEDGEIDQANNLVTEVLDRIPEFSQALFVRARILDLNEESEAAIADLEIVTSFDESDMQAQEVLAHLYNKVGRYTDALSIFERLENNSITTRSAILGHSDTLLALGYEQLAKNKLEDWLFSNPQDEQGLDRFIRAAMAVNNFDDALYGLDELENITGETARTQAARAAIYSQMGDTEAALVTTEHSLLLNSDDQVIAHLANLYLSSGESDRGIDFFANRLPPNENSLVHDLSLAALYVSIKNFPAAETIYRQLTQTDTEDHRAYLAWGNMLVQENKLAAAQAVLGNGLASIGTPLPNTHLPLYAQLAIVQELQGQYLDAMGTYEKMIELDGSFELAINNYIYLIIAQDGSSESLNRAKELSLPVQNTEDPALQDTLAWLYYHLEDYESAYQYAEKAVTSDLELPDLYYHLGKIQLERGRTAEAKSAFEESLKIEGYPFADAVDARSILESME